MVRSRSAPLISVIVPTFRRREAVCRAVRSVWAQSWREWELIVVDDGSRDGTEQALAGLGVPLTYLWQSHRGLAAARNAGLSRARGEIVAFLDSDDQWLPEHLAVIAALFRLHPRAVLVSTAPGYRLSGRASVRRAALVQPFPAILTRPLAGFPSATAVRRAELEAVGGFDESLPVWEDGDLWLRLAVRGPFALVRRRTLMVGRVDLSLSMRARRDGSMPLARERSLRRVARELELTGQRPAAAQVRGALAFAEALSDLEGGRGEELRRRLAEACAALPALSRDWGTVLNDVGELSWSAEPAVLSARLAALAQAWPRRRSPTVAALHVHGALAALRAGLIGGAISHAARTPPLGLLRLVAAAGRGEAAGPRLSLPGRC